MPCEGGVDPLDEDANRQIAKAIDPQWSIAEDFKSISRESGSMAITKPFTC